MQSFFCLPQVLFPVSFFIQTLFIPTAEAPHSQTLDMLQRSVSVLLPSIVSRQWTRPPLLLAVTIFTIHTLTHVF